MLIETTPVSPELENSVQSRIPEKLTLLPTKKELDLFPYPAVLLNDKRILTGRNQHVNTRILPLRVGVRFDRYLSRQDQQRLANLPIGGELFLDIRMPNVYGAIALRAEDGYLIALRDITAHMMRYVNDLTTNSVHFFGDLNEQVDTLQQVAARETDMFRQIRRNCRRTLRCQMELATYFRVTAGDLRKDQFCEVTELVHSVLSCAVKLLRPNGITLMDHLPKNSPSIIVRANFEDLRYAIAAMLSVAMTSLAGSQITVDCHHTESQYTILMGFEPLISQQTLEQMLSGYYRGEVLNGMNRDLFFDLLLLQMLAETSGWHFYIHESGCSGGVLDMILSVPIEASEHPLMLRQPYDDSGLLDLFLGDRLERGEQPF